MAAPDRPDYLKKLAALCADASLDTIGPAVVDRARWIVADSIPVIAAGMQMPEMKSLVAAHLKASPPGAAWVFGAGRRALPIDAALLNGTAGTWLELDGPRRGAPSTPSSAHNTCWHARWWIAKSRCRISRATAIATGLFGKR
jgi:2-methylcitrate dehydratase PrpD